MDEDNTFLWILLGGAVVYFLMKRSQSAPAPQRALPPASNVPGVTQNPDGTLTITPAPLPTIPEPTLPGPGVPNIQTSNPNASFIDDPIFGDPAQWG